MKFIPSILAFLFFSSASLINAFPKQNLTFCYTNEIPQKTVVIKFPGAEDATKFFSATKVVSIYVFKAGTQEDINTLVSKIKAYQGVETVITGKTTGDYTNINISLKELKDKTYWKGLFKAAGSDHIKINNQAVIEIEKL